MSRLFRHIFLICAWTIPHGALAADDASLAPQEGLLLLRTGGIVSGRITRAGDRYYVAVPDGEVRVKVADVELVCCDLQDGYARKRAAIGPRGADGHLELAEWCLRQGLVEEARRELADVTTLDARHPRLPLVQQRLDQALHQKTNPPPQRENQDAVSHSDLDRLVRGMPPHTVEIFTQSIQPLLVNSCAAAGCHGPRSESKFQLIRNVPGNAASRRLTQRNLQSTLQFVDTENPAESLLLKLPTQAHGTSSAPIFTNRQASRYQQLADWVAIVAQSQNAKAAAVEQPASQVVPSTMFSPSAPASELAPVEALPRKKPRAATVSPVQPPPTTVAPAKNPSGAPPAATVDPFDPDAFNRQFHE